MSDWRLAVDIGGTFTDVVVLDSHGGAIAAAKSLTTPGEPLAGVRDGCARAFRQAGIEAGEVGGAVVHATTLVTNALIEGKGARTGLIATSGFGDTLLIRDEHRYDMYDLQIEFPEPVIGADLTFEVDERTLANGSVHRAPDPSALAELAAELQDLGVEAVAISLLHSYANPDNELQVKEALTRELGIPVCASSDVAPQIREYPRMVTTACNAVTMPLVGDYLTALESWLRSQGCGRGLLIMLSNGGIVSSRDAAATPIRMVESGPAAGALATSWYARRLQLSRVLSFDMGGTTAKSCLIEGYEPALTADFEVARMYRFKRGSGYPVLVPSVDLVEIGAGGGSIARVNHLGLLNVGPESAGAVPGPACYDRGGELPTVTDADLLLGFLDADYFLGGVMPLSRQRAETAFESVSAALDMSVRDVAWGVHELVNQNMAAAARMHAIERGVDLRGVPLLAFGGAGPVHACGVAEMLEAEQVIFPVNASVLSAFGTLVTPGRVDLARTLIVALTEVTTETRDGILQDMRTEALRVLEAAGVPLSEVTFRYGIDARYVGQGNELTIWLGEGARWPVTDDEVLDKFSKECESVYGLSIPDVAVEVVTWRLAAISPPPAVDLQANLADGAAAASKGTRPMVFARASEPVQGQIYERRELPPGSQVSGPAVIEEPQTSVVLPPGWRARVLEDGSLMAGRVGA